ncbi:MASE4 domain-containing protein [Caballeronia sp. Lep1P3]|uniref:MASE4 domain-containing protein n=1 Tax=Caballeronia sp. Lep1P3 TaxID=2878150 RepID=UPI002104F845|nr:MASE4 domain-containing protein [Caballeronia sp. Lep1P3]
MQPSLIHLQSSPRHRLTAGIAATFAIVAAVLVWPYAKETGPIIQPFLPMFATWVSLTEGLTALLLWTQYGISGRLLFAALSGAYAFTSVIAVIQLVVFPGVFFRLPACSALGPRQRCGFGCSGTAAFPLLSPRP